MSESHLFRQIQLANQMPLNQAAAAFLPNRQAPAAELAVLTLMRWGLDNGQQVIPMAPHHPDWQQLMTQITLMADWQPAQVIDFLTNPEQLEGETVLEADELAAQETPEDAAALLLENLYNTMVARAP